MQYFSTCEEKKLSKDESEKKAEKLKIIHEEQNPNMAKRHQAIPLPYEELESRKEKSIDYDKSLQEHVTNQKPLLNEHKQLASPMITSWSIHLRLLLIEKLCVVLAVLTEQEYQDSCYGDALKYISLATKCFQIVSKQQVSSGNYLSIGDSYRTNLLARAGKYQSILIHYLLNSHFTNPTPTIILFVKGDCYFQCAVNFDKIDEYIQQHNNVKRDIDFAIENELQKDLIQLNHQDIDIVVELPKNIEQLILLSISSYEMALRTASYKETRFDILGRIGSVNFCFISFHYKILKLNID